MYLRPLMNFFLNKTDGYNKDQKPKQYELKNISEIINNDKILLEIIQKSLHINYQNNQDL